ncbi:MAG TPA: adenosylmethionine--8-amino-7-oxononanoate transaminase [Burkholderiales bacterium]|nr:adenosylmethionine--8-amino-7-oxononanoate transaminase [Burkholderiales bacterium]
MSQNRNLLDRSLRSVWHPCTQMKVHETLPLIPIASGSGAWLHDFDGNRYLDAISSWWVNLFGHANPRIAAAISDQLVELEHVILAGFTHAPAVELAEQLSRHAPGLGHCFFASDGSSAVEIALKMSFHYWRNSGRAQKNGFVCLAGSYHGETLGALSVSDVALFRDVYAPLLNNVARVPSADWRNAVPGETHEQAAIRAAAVLEDHLAANHERIAALIVEPLIQCASGMQMYHPEYLRRARAACDRYSVHLIADEIAVGFGRSGSFFACEQAAIRPDFLCLSKGITGGFLPLSAVLTSDTVYGAFYDDRLTRGFLHSHSYTGNPLACRAALAVLDIFEEDDVLASNRRKAAVLSELCKPIAAHPKVRHFRNTGMIWAFDIDTEDPGFGGHFYQAALQKGLLLRPLGRTVYFMPPYIIGLEEMQLLAEGTITALDTALAQCV